MSPDTYTYLPNDERILSREYSNFGNYMIFMKGITNPQLQNRYSYCINNPINNVDYDGHDTWYISNDFNTSNPTNGLVSHSFVAITDENGNVTHTYSFLPDKGGQWAKDRPIDKEGAAKAIAEGTGATKVGDKSLDPYIEYEFFYEDNAPFAYIFPFCQCKTEAARLIQNARNARDADRNSGHSSSSSSSSHGHGGRVER